MQRCKRLKCLNICRNIWLDTLEINLLLLLFVDNKEKYLNDLHIYEWWGWEHKQYAFVRSFYLKMCFIYMKMDYGIYILFKYCIRICTSIAFQNYIAPWNIWIGSNQMMTIAAFGRLELEAGVGMLWEENTVGLAAAGVVWEKITVALEESRPAEHSDYVPCQNYWHVETLALTWSKINWQAELSG